jgi:cell division protein ZapA (FtsZ GTPase activity inhibitor)
MGKESDVITVEILGTRLQLRGGDNPEGVRKVAAYVKDLVEELAERAPTAPSIQIALLTAINIANEYYESTSRDNSDIEEALDRTRRILSKSQIL